MLTQEERINLLLPVARALYRFSPIIAFDDFSRSEPCGERLKGIAKRLNEESDPWAFGLNVDLSGTERLFADDRELLRKVSEVTAFCGFRSRLSIAPTLGLSWGLSRFGAARLSIVAKESAGDFIETLPIQAFRLSTRELAALSELEIRRGAQLLRMPRSALLDRFGDGILKRIDQMLGKREEALPKCRISFPISAARELDVPVEDGRVLAQHTRFLLEEFLQKARSAHQHLTAFRLEMKSAERQTFQKTYRLSTPSAEHAYLWKLLEPVFDTLALPGGVAHISFSSSATEPQQKLQLPDESAGRQSFAKLLDVIGEHLGPEEIQQVSCRPSHLPERAYAYVPRGSPLAANGVEPQHSEERPSLLFYQPSPLRVIAPLPDGPPAWLEWKEHRYRVARAMGPERIAPPWWGADAERFQTKDYFRVQVLTGSWLWIFREQNSNKWFVHGVWT